MADGLDLNEPLPDRAHEAIRRAVVQAIEDIDWNASSTDLAFELTDTVFQLLATLQDDIAALQSALAALANPEP